MPTVEPPYPSWKDILASFRAKVESGELVIPKEHIWKADEWIRQLAKDEERKQRKVYDAWKNEEHHRWRSKLEATHHVSNFSEKARNLLFNKAWNDGHSEGLEHVEQEYAELVDLIDAFLAKN